MTTQNTDARTKKKSLVSFFVGGLISWFFILIFSLLISIFVEYIGVLTIWKDQGIAHSQEVLNYEYGNIERNLNSHAFIIANDSIKKYPAWLYSRAFENKYTKLTLEYLGVAIIKSGSFINDKIDNQFYLISGISSNVTKIFFIRILVIFLSLPLLILVCLVAVTDGLVERDLRKAGGGRESSMVFNIAKISIKPLLILTFMVYLAWPEKINPVYIILPFSLAVAFALRTYFEKLKKYL